MNPHYYHAATDLAMAYYALGDREQSEHYSQLALLNGESEENLKEALLSVRGIDLDEIDALEDPEENVEE